MRFGNKRRTILFFALASLAAAALLLWIGYYHRQPAIRGDQYYRAGAYAEAAAAYQEALLQSPENGALGGKLEAAYLALSAQYEASGEIEAAYLALVEAEERYPSERLRAEKTRIGGIYIGSTLTRARELGRTQRAMALLEEAYERLPAPRLAEAIEELYRSQWRMTESTSYLYGDMLESYLVCRYAEDGELAQQIAYRNDGSVRWSQEYYYENGRRSGMMYYEGETATRYGEWSYDAEGAFYREYEVGGVPLYAVSYDNTGSIRFFVSYNEDESTREYHEYRYDDAWRRIGEEIELENGERYHYTSRYDAAGALTGEETRDENGALIEWSERTYDSEGELLTVTRSSAEEGTLGTLRYTYDAAGLCTELAVYDSKDELQERYTYAYDAAGRLAMEEYFAAYEVRYRYYEYEYDEADNLLKKTTYYGDGTLKEWTEYAYEYIPLEG